MPAIVDTLTSNSNVLHVSVEAISASGQDQVDNTSAIILSGADKQLHFLSTSAPFDRLPISLDSLEAPVLSCAVLFHRYLISTTMSGKLMLHDLTVQKLIDERRDHAKYVVKVCIEEDDDAAWVATAAWDAKIIVYHIKKLSDGLLKLGMPVAHIKLPTNPDAIAFVQHPEIALPVLVASRRDSTFLYYYALPGGLQSSSSSEDIPSLIYLGRQNLAPHSNAWVAFTPSAFAISPKDPSLLAVATSAVPSMKLIIVRLLLPPPQSTSSEVPVTSQHLTQASQARAELAQQGKEDAAILIHCTTLAPQTAYSTPALAWRPDGTGVYVNGDDGVVRGLETTTGKIKATLKDGHEAGAKIRCLWAGMAEGREVIVSGGFDRRLVVWEVDT